jgi:polysaccharide deacetylase 2 family uncharacterized protein YibQ
VAAAKALLPPLVTSRSQPAAKAPTPPPQAEAAKPLAEPIPPSASPAGAKPIAPPDPALLEPSVDYPGSFLPRVGPDRRSPMQVYAAASSPAEARPRVAILLASIGMNQSETAIRDLPAAVSLAVSPYATRLAPLLDAARAAGHEYLVSIPMEPANFPFDDPGNHALMTGNSDAVNQQQLDWVLTRFAGYVGATGALGAMRGERFAASSGQMRAVLAELAKRGLLYIDPRPGAAHPPLVVGRSVDVVIDDPGGAPEIESRLARLEQIAHDRGSAIGLADLPSPVTVERLVDWANTLASRGIALEPVSAVAPLIPPPAAPVAATGQ